MTYFEFFSKYSDMFYYLTFLLGVTNISYNFFEYLNKYDSSPLSKLEGRIHTRLNDIDNKINMLLCEISHAVSDSESDNSESIIEDEDIHNENENENEKSDSETEEDTSDKEDFDSDSDSDDKEELQIMETIEELEEPEENVCVDQNDINDYYKDKFIKDKQSNSLSLSGVFKGWY